MKLKLKIWRQENVDTKGGFTNYEIDDITPDMSFLEMLDVLNQRLINENIDPISFDHDCREGICGSCSLFINGRAHGPDKGITTCQLHMRKFKDGDSIVVEPFRAKSFPIIKDLVVDRSAFDRIQHSGGYISINTSGNTQDANTTPIRKEDADNAFDAATCIGCGACVATCKNASASLFVAAKVSQLSLLPQGQPEKKEIGSQAAAKSPRISRPRCPPSCALLLATIRTRGWQDRSAERAQQTGRAEVQEQNAPARGSAAGPSGRAAAARRPHRTWGRRCRPQRTICR